MAAATDHRAKHWTYEEYYNLGDDQRYEVHGQAKGRGKLKPFLLPGLEFDLADIQG